MAQKRHSYSRTTTASNSGRRGKEEPRRASELTAVFRSDGVFPTWVGVAARG
jgi:hypothetical protein